MGKVLRGWYGWWYGGGLVGVLVWVWWYGGGMGVVWGWYGGRGIGKMVWGWIFYGRVFLGPFGPSTHGETRALHVCSRPKSRTHTYIQHRIILVVMVVVVVVIVMVLLHR